MGSALILLFFNRIQTPEPDPSVDGGEVPHCLPARFVAALLPGGDLTVERGHIWSPPIQALPCQNSAFTFGDSEPATSDVECHLKHAARRWASSSAKASESDPGPGVFALSTTSTMHSVSGSSSPDSRRSGSATSRLARCFSMRTLRRLRRGLMDRKRDWRPDVVRIRRPPAAADPAPQADCHWGCQGSLCWPHPGKRPDVWGQRVADTRPTHLPSWRHTSQTACRGARTLPARACFFEQLADSDMDDQVSATSFDHLVGEQKRRSACSALRRLAAVQHRQRGFDVVSEPGQHARPAFVIQRCLQSTGEKTPPHIIGAFMVYALLALDAVVQKQDTRSGMSTVQSIADANQFFQCCLLFARQLDMGLFAHAS